jgi:hypothetical protein
MALSSTASMRYSIEDILGLKFTSDDSGQAPINQFALSSNATCLAFSQDDMKQNMSVGTEHSQAVKPPRATSGKQSCCNRK